MDLGDSGSYGSRFQSGFPGHTTYKDPRRVKGDNVTPIQ